MNDLASIMTFWVLFESIYSTFVPAMKPWLLDLGYIKCQWWLDGLLLKLLEMRSDEKLKWIYLKESSDCHFVKFYSFSSINK